MKTEEGKKSHPLVSIIMPCYNAEKYVAEAIQSALDQTYPNCEIIVIDDGSTDGSLDVIKSFGDQIKWETGPNKGGCAARNRGLAISSGEWIQFLDSDDILTPECVETKIKQPRSEKVIVCSLIEIFDSNGEIKDSPKWQHSIYNLEKILLISSPQTAAPLHKREYCLGVGGFREGLPCCQEYDFHLRMALKYKVVFEVVDHVGVKIRYRDDSLSRQKGAPIAETTMRIYLELLEKGYLDGLDSDAVDCFAQAMTVSARGIWMCGQHEKAIRFAEKARNLSYVGFKNSYRNLLAQILVEAVGFKNYQILHTKLNAIFTKIH